MTSSSIAKRAGRYVCVVFSYSPEEESILTVLNRDPALDSQENLGKDFKVEKLFNQGTAMGIVT